MANDKVGGKLVRLHDPSDDNNDNDNDNDKDTLGTGPIRRS
jgi:hypothetical protein